MADANLIVKNDLARVREVDFVYRFNDNLTGLLNALGVTRKIQKQAGTILKAYKATGTLENGAVAEGEDIPLSHYQTVAVPFDEITLKKWAKATSAEAIMDRGFDQAVGMTTDRMLKDVQNAIKADFFTFITTTSGISTVSGNGLQEAMAKSWGKLQVKFEDQNIDMVTFVNPEDVADYLAKAPITLQSAFGMTYIENFLGMGTVFLSTGITKGTMVSTAKENIVLYYVSVNGADLGNAFNFKSDATGLIGIHEEANYTNLTCVDTVMSGLVLFAERIDGIVKATINAVNP